MPGISFFQGGGSSLQIPLDAPAAFSASPGNSQVTLTWTDPLDKYATPEGETAQDPNQLVSVWDHTVLVRKTGSQPAGPNDGTVVVSSSVRNQYQTSGYVDTGLQNDTTYYYGVFAYNKDGVASEGAFVSAMPLSFSPVLEDNTWDQVSLASSANAASSLWAIGDCKSVPLNGKLGTLTINTTFWVFILGFNHNAALEGNGITFGGFKSAASNGDDICLVDIEYNKGWSSVAFRMNGLNTNSGGWEESDMRKTICGTSKNITAYNFPSVIPSDLLNVVKAVTKYTNNTGNSSSSSAVTATTDYFFIPAEYEIFGSITYANSYEANYQKQYDYYAAGNSKVKEMQTNTWSTGDAYWWTRSSRASTPHYFVCVNNGGGLDSNNANFSYGFAPCFVV